MFHVGLAFVVAFGHTPSRKGVRDLRKVRQSAHRQTDRQSDRQIDTDYSFTEEGDGSRVRGVNIKFVY